MTTDTAVAARPGLLQALRIVAGLVSLFILIQAVFAGRGFAFGGENFKTHGYIGNATFLLVVVQTALAFLAGIRGRARGAILGTSAASLVLVIAQIGLGYSGRNGGEAAAWHIPLGVLIFGLSITMHSFLARLRRNG